MLKFLEYAALVLGALALGTIGLAILETRLAYAAMLAGV